MSQAAISPSRRAARGGALSVTNAPTLLALVAVVAGIAWLAWLAAPRPPGNDSVEAGFARDMSTHHAQAVAMALAVRDRTADPQVRTLATDVILTQQAQIGQMRGWLDAWGDDPNGTAPAMAWMGHAMNGPMPGMASSDEVTRLSAAPAATLDEQFLRLMIRHHRGGVAMAQGLLDLSDNGTARRLASSIVAGQQSEIEAMQGMLQAKGVPAEPGGVPFMPVSEEHAGGFFAALPDAARSALRLLPLVVAACAAAWLVADARRGAHRAPSAPDDHGERAEPVWQVLAVAGLLLSAALHLGLTSEHYREMTGYGVFFAVSGVAAAAVAGALLARPWPAVAALGAALAVALIIIFVIFRIIPPPGSDSAEQFDAVGLLSKAAEVAALVGCLMLWRARAPEPRRRAA